MNRRRIHHHLRPLRSVSLLSLCIVTVILWVITGFALRANNMRAIDLRDAVFNTDKQGGDVEQSLQELRSYVHSHMNTDLSTDSNVYPPIQLKYTYERLVSQEKERIASINEKIYVQAQNFCERQNSRDFSGRNRVPCIEKYVSDKGETEKPIPEDLYKFDFASPTWTADLAGWSLVAAMFFTVILSVRFFVELWAKSNHI